MTDRRLMLRLSSIGTVLLLQAMTLSHAQTKWWKEIPQTSILVQDYSRDIVDGWNVKGRHSLAEVAGAGKSLVAEEAVVVTVGKPDWRKYTAEFTLKPVVDSAPVKLEVYPAADDPRHPVEATVSILRHDKEGNSLFLQSSAYDRQYDLVRFQKNYGYTFRPSDKNALKQLSEAGIQPDSWTGKWLRFRVEAGEESIRVWMEGRTLLYVSNPARKNGGLQLELSKGDMLGPVTVYRSHSSDSPFLLMDLSPYCNNNSQAGLGDGARLAKGSLPEPGATVDVRGIPFRRSSQSNGMDNLCLRQAQWTDWKTDPADYYEKYDSLPLFQNDLRTPFFMIPNTDYTAVYILGAADTAPETGRAISFRIGRYSGLGILQDSGGEVPRWRETEGKLVRATLPIALRDSESNERAGCLFVARIPIGNVFRQDFAEYGDLLEMEVTKALKLAVRQPDPCRFRYRPLGLPSSVHIFGMTFEQSPVQMRVTSPEIGNVFNEPQIPEFNVSLRNVTNEKRVVTLGCVADDSEGNILGQSISVTLAPHGEVQKSIWFRGMKRGYHEVTVCLSEVDRVLLLRRTSCALLPRDTRDRRVHAPWGTWSWNGGHNTPWNEVTNVLAKKMGMRHSFGGTDSQLARYGMSNYASPRVQAPGDVAAVRDYLEQNPNAEPRGLIFHEDAISGAHVMRQVDCLLNRSPYQMDEGEQKRFAQMFNDARKAAKEVREANIPGFRLLLGNGNPQLVEEFLRHKFPAEYFDYAGNENCAFMRPTEFPPDNVSFNTIWTFRQILDTYGYRDKPIDACYEWMCRVTNPGNLSEEDQANYYVRDGIMALAWGFKHISPGEICDVGNSYYYSNWGAGGFCHRKPELNPKPAYVAFATLTQVLDKAKFIKVWDTGTRSLYCVEFLSKDNQHAFALWTLRGQRQVNLSFRGNSSATVINWQAREKNRTIRNGGLALEITPSPIYLKTPVTLVSVAGGACIDRASPSDQRVLISKLDNLSDWTIEQDRNTELEVYNFDVPRRKGNFDFGVVSSFEGRGPAIKVTPELPVPGTAFQPMYEVMSLKQGVELPRVPSRIGLSVNGNSGWGRVIFELQDASGQRWTSIGCSMGETPTRWMGDWLPAEELAKVKNIQVADWNTNDSRALSFINFDGWRYVSFPLPGQYDGENYHLPENCNWKSDKDGTVHYPLTFAKLIVELREKSVYATEFLEPARREVYLKDLRVSY